MARNSLQFVALFLTILIVALYLIIIQIDEPTKQTTKTFTVGDSVGSMETFEVDTEKSTNTGYPLTPKSTDRYDRKYLEYFDKMQESRDDTFSGR